MVTDLGHSFIAFRDFSSTYLVAYVAILESGRDKATLCFSAIVNGIASDKYSTIIYFSVAMNTNARHHPHILQSLHYLSN
jgi:hypothetical protein